MTIPPVRSRQVLIWASSRRGEWWPFLALILAAPLRTAARARIYPLPLSPPTLASPRDERPRIDDTNRASREPFRGSRKLHGPRRPGGRRRDDRRRRSIYGPLPYVDDHRHVVVDLQRDRRRSIYGPRPTRGSTQRCSAADIRTSRRIGSYMDSGGLVPDDVTIVAVTDDARYTAATWTAGAWCPTT